MLRCARCGKEINLNNGYLMIWNVNDPNIIQQIRFVCSRKCSENEHYTIVKFESICDLRLKLKELLLRYRFGNEDEELYVKSLISNIWRNKEIGEEYLKSYLMPPEDKKY